MKKQSRFVLLLPLAFSLLVGCQSKNTGARLTGTVKYKGTLLKAGTITLTAKEGGYYSIPIESDGTYSASSLPIGELQVAIETETANPGGPTPQQYGGAMAKGMTSPAPDGSTPEASRNKDAYVKIPAKYADPTTSGLTVNLSGGSNTKDFDLTN